MLNNYDSLMKYSNLAVLVGLFFLATVSSFAQEIDPRVLLNRGEQGKIAFKYNTNSYNYMLFELDHSYELRTVQSLTKEEVKKLRKDLAFTPEQITQIGSEQFNFWSLGIRLSSERQYVQVTKTQVLVFYAIPEVTKAFSQSPLNTK